MRVATSHWTCLVPSALVWRSVVGIRWCVPVGVSIGHTFPLDEGMSITPYVHPRVSLDILNGRATRSDNSEVTLNFDLGANLQVNKQFALRVAGVFSGSDQYGSGNAFTVGFNWTPSALARSVSRGSR